MAAIDAPWLIHMSTPRVYRSSDTLDSSSSTSLPNPFGGIGGGGGGGSTSDGAVFSAFSAAANPNPTYATFSPPTLSATSSLATSAAKRRSTILVHQKSPLLLATPPQVTRALAYSHPFLLPLNQLVGLLSWTTGDPWQSFLLVVAFWAAVLYGDTAVRCAGPVLVVLVLIGGMYGRRFSPLSSSGWAEPGSGSAASDGPAVGAGACDAKGGARGAKTGKSKNLSVDGGLADKTPKSGSGSSSSSGGGGGGGGGGHTAAGGGGGGGTPGAAQFHKSQKSTSEITNTRHQKTLDEIVETLKEFTGRCNILLEPLLELTDFLSTQRTATSATTRPALTTLFVRILLGTPFWFALTLPPLRIITARRVVLVLGTVFLTWHARVMKVARVILWRSATVRCLAALVTGLQFEGPMRPTRPSRTTTTTSASLHGAPAAFTALKTAAGAQAKTPRQSELTKALRKARGGQGTGVRFTFILYENQRRWVGLGWTTSLFAYERAAWTDEHNNQVPPRGQFELPGVEDGSNVRWRWVEGSRWRVDGVPDEAVMPSSEAEATEDEWDYDGSGGRMGWVYYDNKWQNGRRGLDGWGRWTRRRKWYRDAELVEADVDHVEDGTPDEAVTEEDASTPTPSLPSLPLLPPRPTEFRSTSDAPPPVPHLSGDVPPDEQHVGAEGAKDGREDDSCDSASLLSSSSRSGGGRLTARHRVTDSSSSHRSRRASGGAAAEGDAGSALRTSVELAIHDAGKQGGGWGVGDEIKMGLG
ncbi:hypothetical protein P8C59_009363 [Phyllachora maydis]|uniref:Peroxin/Ferlin domain-containing protein n=1 Tax=Phyllachora maydis TaxID=1825666 RepID=A0AAD9ICB9_9PEZI|nr:hypothetical protein P8C59_009363 [Phyllachora maydis]